MQTPRRFDEARSRLFIVSRFNHIMTGVKVSYEVPTDMLEGTTECNTSSSNTTTTTTNTNTNTTTTTTNTTTNTTTTTTTSLHLHSIKIYVKVRLEWQSTFNMNLQRRRPRRGGGGGGDGSGDGGEDYGGRCLRVGVVGKMSDSSVREVMVVMCGDEGVRGSSAGGGMVLRKVSGALAGLVVVVMVAVVVVVVILPSPVSVLMTLWRRCGGCVVRCRAVASSE
ncbi:hypothetical protein E2C01_083877 [Portunus trituberculatus]|uniref:Uncharacterized protein n=1 Tax=Portunus trituberculatus TaxID=210409 RepID=A0A5B7ITN3_PORTR|nr:hypothetical protein [Portunus trituberculatus]